jgi:hypothetical protein
VGRKLKSPTRTISNRGDRPRYIGQIPCTKADGDYLVFDSLSSLYCCLWLEFRRDVVSIAFEPEVHEFEASTTLPSVKSIPDYSCVMDTGEIDLVEAKYDVAALRPVEREKLRITKAHHEAVGHSYEVVSRTTLEKSGLIATVLLLRPYGRLSYSANLLEKAYEMLRTCVPATLEVWRENARKAGVPVGVLYKLLYQQRLAFVARPLAITELRQCLG